VNLDILKFYVADLIYETHLHILGCLDELKDQQGSQLKELYNKHFAKARETVSKVESFISILTFFIINKFYSLL
jgi:hypothetical protein